MKIRNFVGIALLLILSLIYTWYEANRPRPVDWSETYSPKDKIPYGTYITYRSLPELFPDSKIRTSRLSIAEEFGSGRDTSAGTYIFVGSDYRIDALELKHLMQWVEKGNDMFVAAGWIADTLLNALSLKLEQNLNPSGSKLLFAPGHVYPFYKIRFRFCSQPKLTAYEFINAKNDDQPCQHFQQQVQPYDIFMRVTTEDMLHEPPPQSLPPIAGFGNRFHRIIECRIVTVLL